MRRAHVVLACLAISSCTCGQKALLYTGPHAEVTPIAAADGSRTLDFGTVGIGSKKVLPISVLNDGNEDLTVKPAFDASSDPSFSVAFTTGSTLTVSPGATLYLQVMFAPLQAGTVTGKVTLDTNAPSTAHFDIQLTGNGATTTLQICREDGTTETCDDALPTGTNLQVDFGEPALGTPVQAQLLLRAKGAVPIDISSIGLLAASDPAYTLAGVPTLPVTLQPNDTIPLTATFTPTMGGVSTGTLEVLSDASSRSRDDVDLTGKADAPRLCITAADLAFGDVSVGTTASKTAQLTNCGLEPLILSTLTPGGPEFAIGAGAPSLPQTLAVGASLPFPFTFHPTVSGPVSHPLAITTNEPHPSTFTQTGNGVRCTLDVQPGTLAFGAVNTGQSVTQSFQLISIGDSDCTVSALTGPTGDADFTLPTPPTLPLVMPPGLTVSVDVTFAPTTTGNASATVGITSDDSTLQTQTLQLTGSGNTPPPCDFTANPTSVAFGSASVGQTTTMNVVVTNIGTSDDCYITGGGTTGDASFAATLPAALPPTTVNSGSSVTIPVKYTPQDASTHMGVLTIQYADQPIVITGASTLRIPLSGGSLAPALCLMPTALDYGQVAPGNTSAKSFVIQSCGAGSLTVRGVTFGAGTSHDFSMPTPPNVPLTLAPQATATIDVIFSPSTASGSAGSVQVLSNDPMQPVAPVSLRGNLGACATQLVCTPASLDFSAIQVGMSGARQVNCTNGGTSPVTITGATASPGSDADITLLAGTFPLTLQPGGVLRAQVQFAPMTAVAGTATFTFQTGGCGNAAVQVQALGVPPKFPPCPPIAAFTPKVKWAWNGSPGATDSTNLVMTPAVVNLNDDNGDGVIDENDIPDVIFSSCSASSCCQDCLDVENQQNADVSGVGILTAVSGKDGSNEWALTDPKLSVPAGSQIAIADLDGDGIPEIIAVHHAFQTGVACPGIPGGGALPVCGKYTTGNLLILDNKGNVKFFSENWTQPEDVIENDSSILVADLDQDGSPEIIFGDTVFDSTGHVKWHMSQTVGDNGHGTFPIAADVNGDGKLEVIAGPTAYNADGSVLWHASGQPDGFALVADVDGDGKPEVILRPAASQLVVLDGATGAVKRTINLPYGAPQGIDPSACPAGPSAADFLGIGSMQLAVPAGTWFYLVRGDTGAIVWQQPIDDDDPQGQCGASGAAAFSFFGDGKTDVVYHDTEHIYVWRGDGTLVYEAPRESTTLFETPVIADVDNDGHAEVLITNQGIGGTSNGLTCLSDAADSWPATRRVWGQWNYHVTDYNENGTIPRVEQPFWKTTKLWRGNPALCTTAH